jgi:hypothetical protein
LQFATLDVPDYLCYYHGETKFTEFIDIITMTKAIMTTLRHRKMQSPHGLADALRNVVMNCLRHNLELLT